MFIELLARIKCTTLVEDNDNDEDEDDDVDNDNKSTRKIPEYIEFKTGTRTF